MISTHLLALLLLAPLPIDDLEKPPRKPDGGGYFEVNLAVPYSGLALDSGPKANYRGLLWFERLVGKKFQGATSLTLVDRSGQPAKLPNIEFEVDANLNARGAEEALGGGIPDALCLRAVSSSGISLLPVRTLVPHLMEYAGRQREALAEWQAVGATVAMHERSLGPRRLRGDMADQYFTHTVRRLQPSGYELHDFVFTCEIVKDETVLYGRGIRLLTHPTAKLPSGESPPSGVFQMLSFNVHQREWLSDEFFLDQRERSALDGKFEDSLVNALFDAMDGEGVGNPFESPAAFALVKSDLLNAHTMKRMINLKNSKLLTLTAPPLVENPFEFDTSVHLTFWKTADDPAERLLLAAAARAGGADEPAFREEAQLAIGSGDPIVLRAALVLAQALKDRQLTAAAQKALGQ